MPLAQVILFVRDIPRMQSFYGGLLGLAPVEAADGYVRLDAGGGVVLMLHAIPEPASDDAEPVARADAYTKLCFHVDDVDAAREALAARGVRMRDPKRWGDVCFCDGLDPEGNVFQITTR